MSRDNWLGEYDVLVQLGDEIMEKINERNRHARGGSSSSRLSTQIRGMMNKFSKDLNTLKQGLTRASSSYHITDRELKRREDMLSNLTSRHKQLTLAFREEGTGSDAARGVLFQGGSAVPTATFAEETAYTRGLSADELRQQQQQMIAEQDRGLEALSHALSRQKQMGLAIGEEVEYQNEILDDLADSVDNTNRRLVKETKNVRKIQMKASDTGMFCTVILLLIVIIIVAVVPKP